MQDVPPTAAKRLAHWCQLFMFVSLSLAMSYSFSFILLKLKFSKSLAGIAIRRSRTIVSVAQVLPLLFMSANKGRFPHPSQEYSSSQVKSVNIDLLFKYHTGAKFQHQSN